MHRNPSSVCHARAACVGLLAAMLVASPAVAQPATSPDSAASTESVYGPLHRYRGFTQPSREVVLTAPVDGLLLEIGVEEDEAVSARQVVAQMDDRVEQARIDVAATIAKSEARIRSAEAGVRLAELELVRVQQMQRGAAANDMEVETAKARLDQARADLDLAQMDQAQAQATLKLEQAQAELLRLTAPFEGVLIDRDVEPGASLRVADPVARIVQLDPLEVDLPLPVALYDQMQVGRSYRLMAGPPVGGELVAELTRIRPEVDPASDTARFRFEIDNPGQRMPAGFTVWLADPKPVAQTPTSLISNPRIPAED